MLSIGKMSVGQHAYYDELAKEDYYLDGGEPPGKWLGQGASALSLSGEIRSKDFSDLFAGELRGKRLVQQSESTRCPGWDLTFSAPKSVSVALSQADAAKLWKSVKPNRKPWRRLSPISRLSAVISFWKWPF